MWNNDICQLIIRIIIITIIITELYIYVFIIDSDRTTK